jgi:hypothetical protein
MLVYVYTHDSDTSYSSPASESKGTIADEGDCVFIETDAFPCA